MGDGGLLDFAVEICDKVGARPPGSEAERKTAQIIAKRLEKCCDEVVIEEFVTCPRVLQALIDFVVYSYLVALILYLFLPYLSAIFVAIGFSVFYLTRFRGKEILDKFARKARSQNVIGRIKPTGKVKKYVIFFRSSRFSLYDAAFSTKISSLRSFDSKYGGYWRNFITYFVHFEITSSFGS